MSTFAALRSARWVWLFSLLGCSTPLDEGPREGTTPSSSAASATDASPSPPCAPGDAKCASALTACSERVPIWSAGRPDGDVCLEQAPSRGLTVVDLSEEWAPRVIAGAPYRDHYARAAREEFGTEPEFERERRDRHLELYGIFPSFAVMAKRLADRERHACHAMLSSTGLEALSESVDTWRSRDRQRADRLYARTLKSRLDEAAAKQRIAVDDLATDTRWSADFRLHRTLTVREQAIRDMQHHLKCERLLKDGAEAGILDNPTIEGMNGYMRRHMIVSWQLDEQVRAALLTDSRELDYRQALRSLRERVADATGLIEDGSASGRRGLVMDRAIDTPVFLTERESDPLVGAAGDLIARATDEAARALGWTDPSITSKALSTGLPARVAVRLPPVPDYHSTHMDIVAVIDRGDVVYDPPNVRPRPGAEAVRRDRLPTLVLYAKNGDLQTPLVRWPTTVGGWQPEWVPGRNRVMLTYKESPPGTRIWRDVVAEPRWLPPPSTPERDLVRPGLGGVWAPRFDTFGPSYASAYGLVMLMHHQPVNGQLGDQGIRTHGSANYASILEGFSHGCHRLHNHRALRLSSFLLAHRHHEVRGPLPVGYLRNFSWRGKPMRLSFESRGFRYELTPPVEVEVLEGRVRGAAQRPLPPQELPAHLRGRYARDD